MHFVSLSGKVAKTLLANADAPASHLIASVPVRASTFLLLVFSLEADALK